MVTLSIHSIPDETLCEIFLRCLPARLWEVSMSPRQAPILLTHVCQHWREVATDFPPLWARICLSFKEGRGYSSSQRPIFEEWASRSKSTALSLHIQIKTRWICDTVLNVPNVRLEGIFIPVIQSLTRLTLNRVPVRHIRALPSGLFVSLECLAVLPSYDGLVGWSTTPVELPVKAFRDAPSLRRVALMTGEREIDFSLPLEQLTHCVLQCDSWGNGHRRFLARDLYRLVELRFLYIKYRSGGVYTRSPPCSNPTCMEKVEALVLSYPSNGVTYPDILEMYDFPNLTSLQIEGTELDIFSQTAATSETWKPPRVERFLTKLEKLDRLEHLSMVIGLGVSTPTFQALFRALPHLTTLEFWMDCSGYDHGFRLLTYGQDPEAQLLVQLRTFIVGFGASTPINPYAFRDFLKSRVECSDDIRLQKLVVHAPSRYFQDLSVAMEESRRHGLKVEEISTDGGSAKERSSWVLRDRGLRDWTEVQSVLADEPFQIMF